MHENFKRILVTTDFSESGDRAIAHAFRMAADHSAEVILCHVVEMIVAPNPLYAQYYPSDLLSPEIQQRAEQEAQQALRERVPKDEALAKVPYTTLVLHGLPADEVIRAAESRAVELVVIATHGRTGLKHLFMGSTAERIIRHVHCPVLVVR
jgi:universal stress protein A